MAGAIVTLELLEDPFQQAGDSHALMWLDPEIFARDARTMSMVAIASS